MGKQKPFKGIIEPHLGIIESLWGIIEPLLGITKPAEGINKPYLGDFVISVSSAASEAKTSIIIRTAGLYAQICLRTINLLNSYYLKIIFSEPSLDIRTSSFVYNYYQRKKKFTHSFLYFRYICMKLYTLHMHTHQKQIEYPYLLSMPLGKEDYSYLSLTHLVFFSIGAFRDDLTAKR